MKDDEIAAALDVAGETLAPAGSSVVSSWKEAYTARTVAVKGGHLHWTGAMAGDRPLMTFRGRVYTVYGLAFRWHYGRDPEGTVRPACAYPVCVAGGHLADQRMRAGGAS